MLAVIFKDCNPLECASNRRQDSQLRDAEAATLAFEAGAQAVEAGARAAAPGDLGSAHRVRRSASHARDLQRAAEAGEIGGVPHMLGGHRAMLGMAGDDS